MSRALKKSDIKEGCCQASGKESWKAGWKALALQIKFGSHHVLRLIPRLQAIVDCSRLDVIKEALKTAKEIKEIENLLNEQ